jgi:hypothetical protein
MREASAMMMGTQAVDVQALESNATRGLFHVGRQHRAFREEGKLLTPMHLHKHRSRIAAGAFNTNWWFWRVNQG